MDRFVVGTGRCGSTLLSAMLGEHRDVVGLQEFFTGLDWAGRFRPGEVDGNDLARVIGAEQAVTNEVLRRGYTADEIRYPFGTPGARHVVGDPLPWTLVATLPHLSNDPDGLYDEMMAWARARPVAPLASHYRDLFEWHASRAGGALWIERSGASLDYLGSLIQLFPEARFVHLHRDGHEAALSMRDHPFFRLGIAVFQDLFPPGLEEEAQIDHVIETPPPIAAAGRFWSDQVVEGFRVLPRLDRSQYLALRFEDLLARPEVELERIAAFFELPADDTFLSRAAALVREPPTSRFDRLCEDEQAELAAACHPGQRLLGR